MVGRQDLGWGWNWEWVVYWEEVKVLVVRMEVMVGDEDQLEIGKRM